MPTNLQKLNLYEFVTSKIFESCPSGIKWGLASISRSWGQARLRTRRSCHICHVNFCFVGTAWEPTAGPRGWARPQHPCRAVCSHSALCSRPWRCQVLQVLGWIEMMCFLKYSQVFSSPMLCCHKRSVGKNIPSQQSSLKFRVKGSMSVQLRQG